MFMFDRALDKKHNALILGLRDQVITGKPLLESHRVNLNRVVESERANVIIDFAKVESMCPRMVLVLTSVGVELKLRGRSLTFCNLQPNLVGLFSEKSFRKNPPFSLADSLEEALENIFPAGKSQVCA